jgi:hypothetical protein
MILASMAAAEAAPDLVGGPGDGLAVAPAGSVGTDPGEGAAVPEETEAPADRVLRSASASSQPATPSDGAAIESREQLRQRFDLLTEGLLDGVEPVRPMVPGATR